MTENKIDNPSLLGLYGDVSKVRLDFDQVVSTLDELGRNEALQSGQLANFGQLVRTLNENFRSVASEVAPREALERAVLAKMTSGVLNMQPLVRLYGDISRVVLDLDQLIETVGFLCLNEALGHGAQFEEYGSAMKELHSTLTSAAEPLSGLRDTVFKLIIDGAG